MATTIDYAAHIIDLSDAMLEHREGLNDEQFKRVSVINRATVDFVTEFMQYETTSAPALLNYLTNQAARPLRAVMKNAKMMLIGECGAMENDYAEAVQEIFDCGRVIIEDVHHLRDDLQEFMKSIGMEV